MDIEITYSPYSQAALSCLVMGEEHELLGSYEWLDWLRRKTKNDRLFVYRHRVAQSYVLCVWVWSPKEATNPIATELEVFHGSPSQAWPEGLLCPAVLLARLRPVEEIEEQRKRRVKLWAEAKRLLKDQHRGEIMEAVGHLRSKGLHNEAAMIESGRTPFAGASKIGQDRLDEVTDDLARISRGTKYFFSSNGS